jgi:hypothetical protein
MPAPRALDCPKYERVGIDSARCEIYDTICPALSVEGAAVEAEWVSGVVAMTAFLGVLSYLLWRAKRR